MKIAKNKKIIGRILLAAVLAALAGASLYLIASSSTPPPSSGRARRLALPAVSFRRNQPLALKDVPSIQSWMTFDYLNKVFVLPAGYLSSTLQIADSRYPNLTINHYARLLNVAVPDFLARVQAAVANYLKSH